MGMLIKSDNKATLPVLQSSQMLDDQMLAPYPQIKSGFGQLTGTTPKVSTENLRIDYKNMKILSRKEHEDMTKDQTEDKLSSGKQTMHELMHRDPIERLNAKRNYQGSHYHSALGNLSVGFGTQTDNSALGGQFNQQSMSQLTSLNNANATNASIYSTQSVKTKYKLGQMAAQRSYDSA